MDENKIKQNLIERKALFIDAVRGKKKPKRTPLLSHDYTYKIFDAGYTLKDCLYDYDKMADAQYKFHEKYNFDLYMNTGNRNPVKMVDNFDAEIYTVNNEEGFLNFKDMDSMTAPQGFIDMTDKGLLRFTFEDVLPGKYNVKNSEDGIRSMVAAAKELKIFTDAFGKVQNTLIDKYGVPALCKGSYFAPSEIIFSAGLRGIKSFSMDMRRYGDLIEEMIKSMDVTTSVLYENLLDSFVDDERTIFPARTISLAHTIMNPKQYEKFYWPSLKYFADQLEKRDMTALIFAEGSIAHVYEFFRELPKNRITIVFEQDSPEFIKSMLPNITPAGGFPIDMLKNGTKNECIDKAKEMLNTMAFDGRWVYCQSKMLSYKNDCNPDNLKAVNDWLRENATFKEEQNA